MFGYLVFFVFIGICIFFSGIAVNIFLGEIDLGVKILFSGLYVIFFFGTMLSFYIKAEINGKPASAGLKLSFVGFLLLATGLIGGVVFGINLSFATFCVVVGLMFLVIGFVVHLSYFF